MEDQLTSSDEISLKDLILKIKAWYDYLLRKWMIIVLAGIMGSAIGLTYALLKKPVYIAETTFVLEEGGGSGGGLGAYVGLASMMGLDLNAGGDGIFRGDNILELYKSRKMIQQALLSKDSFEGNLDLLINRFLKYHKTRETWEIEPLLKNINFDIPHNKYTLKHDSIIAKLVDDINREYLKVEKPDKKLSIIKVTFKGKDELFAKSFADKIVATVNDFYVKTKTKKTAENIDILQHQADSVRRILNHDLTGVALAMDANPNVNLAFQTLRVPSQRRQIDVQANAAIYQEIVKNLELSKVSLRKEKPLIQVIDEPIFPLKKEKLGKAKGLIIGGICGGLLMVMFLCIRSVFKQIMIGE